MFRPNMLNFQPMDVSKCGHQVVTATGESSLLYGNQHDADFGDEDVSLKQHVSQKDFPAKKPFTFQKVEKDIIKPAKFIPKEIDVSSGSFQDKVLVSLKEAKKQKAEVVDLASVEVIEEPTPDNLNIQLRHDANTTWLDAIIKNGKAVQDSFSQFGLHEDSFEDFNHLNSRVYDEYLKGFVILGTNRAVTSLLNETHSLKMGTHGVIVDTSLTPSYDGLYEEGDLKCSQYKILKKLGEGSFGTVSYCSHSSGQHYVKKVINKKFNRKEVEVLMQLSHPNITAFRGYVFRDGSHEIMMEYGGDSLKTFMEKNRKNYKEVLTYSVVQKLALQGFSALEYMYERFGILHLDIKPENICVQMDEQILKFTDFGTSKTPQQAVSFDGWTPEYMSPEACRLVLAPKIQKLPKGFVEELTGKADVFAFGLAVCFMLIGNHTVCTLWPPKFTPEAFSKWRSEYICHLAMNPDFMQHIAVKDEWPKEMRDFLNVVLEGRTSRRLSASEACHFIKTKMLNQEANIPALQSLGSGHSLPADLVSMESIVTNPSTSMDVSLQKSQHHVGGKDIKNQLRRKIRRKSCTPYHRETSIAVKRTDDGDSTLPIFAELGMD